MTVPMLRCGDEEVLTGRLKNPEWLCFLFLTANPEAGDAKNVSDNIPVHVLKKIKEGIDGEG